jgi:ribosomal protein L11 methyltransferase
MDYIKYQINCDPAQSEILIALLSQEPFDTFQEHDNGFDAYLPAKDFSDALDSYLIDLQAVHQFFYSKESLLAENWNEVWESNFHPVVVADFCAIRADFHEPIRHVAHELVINPKMAFGTGHHETTWMMLRLMRDLDFGGVEVLDFGCGTGILAMLASRLGASQVEAVDIEEPSFENTKENCTINHIYNVQAWLGGLDAAPRKPYGIVLANINRNVILDSLPTLSGIVVPGGWLVISGFLAEDEPLMQEGLHRHGFDPETVSQRNNWLAISCRRRAG